MVRESQGNTNCSWCTRNHTYESDKGTVEAEK